MVELESKCVKLHFGCSSTIHATLGKLCTTKKSKAVLRVIQKNLNFKYATDLKVGNLLNPVVPKHFGTRDQFHGREFFHGLGQGDGLEIIFIRSSQP